MPLEIQYRELENAGAMKIRFLDVSVTDYTDGGEIFRPRMAGMNRFQHVTCMPTNGDVFSFGYDRDQEKIVLDVASGEDVELELMVVGK